MSHHYSGPDASFPHGDARLDLTDLYAFPKPGSAGKSILIMNVHPSSSIKPPQPTCLDPFAADALYELKIDTDGDAVADIAYRVRFSPFTGGAQTATLRRVEGAQAAGTGDDGQIIIEHAPVSLDRDARITEAGDHRFFAGWRSDPFFFDPVPSPCKPLRKERCCLLLSRTRSAPRNYTPFAARYPARGLPCERFKLSLAARSLSR